MNPPAVSFLGLNADQWELAGTIATALSFVVAAIVASVAVIQLRHSRRIHRDQTRPYMVVTFETGQTSAAFLDLVVKNIGTTPAYNLRIESNPPLARAREEEGWLIAKSRIFSEITPMWAPGFEFRQFFESQLEIAGRKKRDKEAGAATSAAYVDRFEITLTYSSAPARSGWWRRRPRTWREVQILDPNYGEGSLYTDVYGIHHAADALREIKKILKGAKLDKAREVIVEDRATMLARVTAERQAMRAQWDAQRATAPEDPDETA